MDITWRLTRHLETRIRAQWPEGPRALVAGVSGGADSVCLLHLLHAVSLRVGFGLSVLHVHHGIRGQEADGDARFVAGLCGTLDIPLDEVRVDAPLLATACHLSLEDAARRLRHQAFYKVGRLRAADAVVLAHHRDDQAETVLLHLLRGAASDGACGMREFRSGLFRPLLEIPVAELRACLVENGWEWREDGSNEDTAHRRNALRRNWIPMLRAQLGHDPAAPLARFATMACEDQALLDELAREAAVRCGLSSVGEEQPACGLSSAGEEQPACALELAALRAQPPALARRIVRLAWEKMTGTRADLEAVHVAAVLSICAEGHEHARVSLPGGRVAEVSRGSCRFLDSAELSASEQPQSAFWAHDLHWPEPMGVTYRTEVPEAGGALLITRLTLPAARCLMPALRGAQRGRVQVLDSSAAFTGIQVRNRRPGDRFHPWRAPGARKLKDWLIDQKVPVAERDGLPLLVTGHGVLWVPGLRTAAAMCATGGDAEVFLVAWAPCNT